MSLLGLAAAAVLIGCAPERKPSPRFEDYVARVFWSVNDTCLIQGSAAYIGDGRFVTAAHVLNRNPDGFRDCDLDTTRQPLAFSPTYVDYQGRRLVARRLVAGDGNAADADSAAKYLTGGDAAVLQVPPDLLQQTAGRATLRLCSGRPYPPTAALVVTINGAWRATARMLSQPVPFGNVDYLARHTDSGGAVIDLDRRCLLGVLSHLWPWTTPNSTNFASVASIRQALGE